MCLVNKKKKIFSCNHVCNISLTWKWDLFPCERSIACNVTFIRHHLVSNMLDSPINFYFIFFLSKGT